MAITQDDFKKIWASTSPLTPYEFSESQYKEGWNFIGSTPPSRQMWDFLQKQNDEKMQYLANNYLPLSGGSITGDLTAPTINATTKMTAPTVDSGDNSQNVATTEFVTAAVKTAQDAVQANVDTNAANIEANATALLTKVDSSNIFAKQIGQGSSFSFTLVSNGAVIIVFRGNNAQLFVVDWWSPSGYAVASIGNTLASVSKSNTGITVKNIGSAGAMMTYIFNLPSENVG